VRVVVARAARLRRRLEDVGERSDDLGDAGGCGIRVRARPPAALLAAQRDEQSGSRVCALAELLNARGNGERELFGRANQV
jgi:hypothetical protein